MAGSSAGKHVVVIYPPGNNRSASPRSGLSLNGKLRASIWIPAYVDIWPWQNKGAKKWQRRLSLSGRKAQSRLAGELPMPHDQGDRMKLDWQAAHEAIQYLSSKWILAVVAELALEPKGHNDLARATGVLDHKSLDRALRRLETAGLVHRTVRNPPHSSPRVSYRLTDKAYALLPLLQELASWWHVPGLGPRLYAKLLRGRTLAWSARKCAGCPASLPSALASDEPAGWHARVAA